MTNPTHDRAVKRNFAEATGNLNGAEVFSTGVHNGGEITSDDLSNILTAWQDLDQANKVPLVLGHNGQDSDPALGWVKRLYRNGDTLLADFSDVPVSVIDDIKAGRYRHISIEVMYSYTYHDVTYPMVLFRVALLGAAPPAVRELAPLSALVLSQQAEGAHFTRRATFDHIVGDRRGEMVELKHQLLHVTVERDIAAGKVLPRARDAFFKQFGERATLQQWQTFAQNEPRGIVHDRPTSRVERSETTYTRQQAESMSSCQAFSALCRQIMNEEREAGRQTSYEDASLIARERDPQLFRAYVRREDI